MTHVKNTVFVCVFKKHTSYLKTYSKKETPTRVVPFYFRVNLLELELGTEAAGRFITNESLGTEAAGRFNTDEADLCTPLLIASLERMASCFFGAGSKQSKKHAC